MAQNASECLKFCTADWPPFTIFLTWTPPYKVAGGLIDVINIIAEKLGICYELVRASDNDWGSELPNGSWSGTLGMLNRGEADMSAVVYSVTEKRTHAVDFSVPVYMDEMTMSYMRPLLESDMAGFIKPYTYMVWAVMFAAFLVVSVVLACFESSHDYIRFDTASESTPPTSLLGNLNSSSFWVFSILLGQSDQWRTSARMLAAIWLLMVLVVSTVYRSNLMAMLISPKVKLPFDSLEELADTDATIWGPLGSVFHDALNDAPRGSALAGIRDRVYLSNFAPAVRNDYFDGKWGLTSTRTTLIYYLDVGFSRYGYCKHYIMSKGFFGTTSLSLAFPKNSTLKPKVNDIIHRLRESGIIEHRFKSWVANATECLKPVGVESSSVERPLELGDFYGVFLGYCAGIALAAVSLLVELAVGRRETSHQD